MDAPPAGTTDVVVFSDQNRTENLAALGFKPTLFSAIPISGFSFPTFVGPFTTVDARVTGSQTVLDLSIFRRYQSSKVGVTAARSDSAALTSGLLRRACCTRSLMV